MNLSYVIIRCNCIYNHYRLLFKHYWIYFGLFVFHLMNMVLKRIRGQSDRIRNLSYPSSLLLVVHFPLLALFMRTMIGCSSKQIDPITEYVLSFSCYGSQILNESVGNIAGWQNEIPGQLLWYFSPSSIVCENHDCTPHICHFIYTGILCGWNILHPKCAICDKTELALKQRK